MANQFIIIKKDGIPTTPMAQAQAESYLGNLIEANRLANLKQALNDVANGKGKATGNRKFNNIPVLHASSGVMGVKSLSLFFYDNNRDHYIVAMGKHVAASSYTLSDYGQPSGDFKNGITFTI